MANRTKALKLESDTDSSDFVPSDDDIEGVDIEDFIEERNDFYKDVLIDELYKSINPKIPRKKIERIVNTVVKNITEIITENYNTYDYLKELKECGATREELKRYKKIVKEIQDLIKSEEPTLLKIIKTPMSLEEKKKCLNMLESLSMMTPFTYDYYQLRQDIIDTICKFSKKAQDKDLESDLLLNLTDTRSLKDKILRLDSPKNVKSILYSKYLQLENLRPEDHDYSGQKTWLEQAVSIPYNISVKFTGCTRDIITNIKQKLDNELFGMPSVKNELLMALNNSITSPNSRKCIALCGPPGVGKTSIAKAFASSIGVPFEIISLGGMKDVSSLYGFEHTYVNSAPGLIAKILIKMGCNNGVILFDEVDKSDDRHSKDIQHCLLHITDYTQNNTFRDKYFSDIPIDISKLWMIFSMNSSDLLDIALKDRLPIINVEGYKREEKQVIVNQYIIPKEIKNIGLTETDIVFSEGAINRLLDLCTDSGGIRYIEHSIRRIVSHINLQRVCGDVQLPFTVTEDNTPLLTKISKEEKFWSYIM